MEELSPDAREILLEMRRADVPRTGARARVRRQLALSLGGAASLSVAGSSAALLGQASAGADAVAITSGAVASVSVAKLALLVVIGAAGASALLAPVALLSETPRVAPKSLEMPQVRSVANVGVSPPQTRSQQVSPNAAVGAEAGALARARVTPSASIHAPAELTERRQSSSLATETRLLEAVRERLRAGRPAEGLALLDEHARAYANGALREEAAASRVFALCALGRADDALAAASRFQAAFPRSPLGPRVARACSSP